MEWNERFCFLDLYHLGCFIMYICKVLKILDAVKWKEQEAIHHVDVCFFKVLPYAQHTICNTLWSYDLELLFGTVCCSVIQYVLY